MNTPILPYQKWLIAIAMPLLIYLVWGYFGFAGAWIPGRYDAETNTYQVPWSKMGFECQNGYFRIKAYTPFKKHGLCDTLGRIIVPFRYEYVNDMSEYRLVLVGNKRKYGVMNNQSEVIIAVEYQYIRIKERYIRASIDSVGGHFGMKSKAYDLDGNQIFPIPWLDYLNTHQKDEYNTNVFLVGIADSVSYLYFFDTKKIFTKKVAIHAYYPLDEKAKEAYVMTAHKSSGSNEKPMYALMDKNGEDLLPYEYDYIKPTVNDVFIVQQGNLFGVYDAKSRNWVLPVNYLSGNISIMLNGHLVGIKKGNRFRYADRDGNVILSEKNHVISFDNDVINFTHPNGNTYHLVYNEVKKRFYWHRGAKEL